MGGFKTRFIKNLFVSGAFTYAIQGVRFLSTIILSRLLLPNEYGIVAMIQVFSGFLIVFRNTGLVNVIIRDRRLSKKDYQIFNTFTVYIGVVQGILLAMLAFPISAFYNNSELFSATLVLSIIFVISGFCVIPYSLLRMNHRFKRIGIIEFIASVSGIFMAILFAYFGFSYWSLIFQEVIQTTLLAILFYRYYPIYFAFISWNEVVSVFSANRHMILNSLGFGIVHYFARNFDSLLVGKVYGEGPLGIYNRGYSLLYMVNSLVNVVVSRVTLPFLNGELASDNELDLNERVSFVNKIALLATYPFVIIFTLFNYDFVKVMWGEEWIGVEKVLYYFGILILIQSPLSLINDILVTIGREKSIFPLGLVNSIISIAGITYGSVYGYVEVAKYYMISNVIFILPLNLYLVLYKLLHISFFSILKDWALIIVLCFSLAFFSLEWIQKLSLVLAIGIQLIFMNRYEIIRFFKKFGIC